MLSKRLFFAFIPSFFVFFIVFPCCAKKERTPSIENAKKRDFKIRPIAFRKRSYWPTRDWQKKRPEEVNLSGSGLLKLEEYAFGSSSNKKKKQEDLKTNSLLIIKDGYLVYEKYARNYNKDSPQQLWSVSKCFVNALIGIAHKKGLLELDKAAYHYLPTLDRPDKREITVRHLLSMTSGIEWSTKGDWTAPLRYDDVFMLWGKASNDMARIVAQRKMYAPAGSYIYYSSGDSMLLSALLRKVLQDDYSSYPWKALFNIIGTPKVIIERDRAGNFILGAYAYATARDLAKFAFLYLNKGRWAGQSILSEEWIKFTRTIASAYARIKEKRQWIKKLNLSAHWYVNTGLVSADIPSPWPLHTPRDTFGCLGQWRQRILIIPSLDMIIVRTAEDREELWKNETLFKIMNESVLIKS